MERPTRDGCLILTMQFGNRKVYPFSEFPVGMDWTVKDRFIVIPTGLCANTHAGINRGTVYQSSDANGMKLVNLTFVVEVEEIDDSDEYRGAIKEFQRQCNHEWDEPPKVTTLFGTQDERAPHCKKCDVCMSDLDALYSNSGGD